MTLMHRYLLSLVVVLLLGLINRVAAFGRDDVYLSGEEQQRLDRDKIVITNRT